MFDSIRNWLTRTDRHRADFKEVVSFRWIGLTPSLMRQACSPQVHSMPSARVRELSAGMRFGLPEGRRHA